MSEAPPEAPEALATPGTKLGPYVINSPLGSGAMGAVYEATDPRGGLVALKVLKRALADDPVHVERMGREAEALRALSHPHVVPVVDAGRLPDGRAFVAMERLRGSSLDEVLAKRGRPFEPGEAWALLRGVAQALDAAHALGITHRDVKPANVFVTEQGAARLLDFGVAKFSATPQGMTLTETGAMVGTPAYMAPEQWWGQPAGPASDQYALAVTLFEALTGAPPFAGAFAELLQAHLHTPPPTLASRGLRATPEQEALLAKALSKEPADRYPTMREFVEAADLALGVFEDRQAIRRENTLRRAGAVLVALALGPLALALEGYGASHSPKVWLQEMGTPGFFIAALCPVALACLALGYARVAAGCAVLFACLGTFVLEGGVSATTRASERFSQVNLFAIYAMGFTESATGRFTGLGFAAATALGALVLSTDTLRATEARWAQIARVLSGLFVVFALGCVLAHTPKAALFALCAALLALLSSGAPQSRARELGRAVTGALVLAASAGVVASQLQATVSLAWSLEGGRPARVRVLLDAWHESQRTWTALGLTAVVLAVFSFERVRAAPGSLRALRFTGARALACAAFALWIAGETHAQYRMNSASNRLYEELSPQFSLFARLDPPSVASMRLEPPLGPPPRAPSVRIARDVVAIDDVRVGLTRALGSPESDTSLALDLSHRLARDEAAIDRPTQLTITADRSVPSSAVGRVLSVAYGLGVTRVAFVLSPTDEVVAVPRGAPPEVFYVLPRDFVALHAALESEGTPSFAGEGTYAEALRPLLAAPRTPSAPAVRVSVQRSLPPVR